MHIVDEVPELEHRPDLPLVVALDGFLDAGNAATLAAKHINRAASAPVVATFDADEFHDYRARRPAVTFSRDHYTDYAAPRLVVRLARDEVDTPYLLLTGPEPDARWEAFARAVKEVVERFEVGLVLTLDSVPMTTPTRGRFRSPTTPTTPSDSSKATCGTPTCGYPPPLTRCCQ